MANLGPVKSATLVNGDTVQFQDGGLRDGTGTLDVDAAIVDGQNVAETCIKGTTTTLAVGTTTVALSGITDKHVVLNWGFGVGDQNNPPADIEVVTSDDSYTITVATLYTSGATMTPIFIKPYNV